jgi:hypothetical protein
VFIKKLYLKIKLFFSKETRTIPRFNEKYLPFKVGSLVCFTPWFTLSGSINKKEVFLYNEPYSFIIVEDLFPVKHAYMCYVLDKNCIEEFCALTLHCSEHKAELISK